VPGKSAAIKEQQIPNHEVLRKLFEFILWALNTHFNLGKVTLCGDGQIQLCYPVIGALMADYFKIIQLYSNKQPYCAVCEAPESSFGEANSSSWQLRDCRLHFQKITHKTLADEMQRREARQ
jgi:hypothetical protein